MLPIAEDPTGHLPISSPSVLERRKVGKDNVLGTGQPVVLPLDLWPAKVLEGWIW